MPFFLAFPRIQEDMQLRRDPDDPEIPIPPEGDPPPPVEEPPNTPQHDPPAPVREPGPTPPRRL